MTSLDFAFTGDLILDYPNPDHWLSGIVPALRQANLSIGHLEVPHTDRGQELLGDVPAPAANPAHLAALARAGFTAVSMAGNHMSDCGAEGIVDTIDELDRLGIHHAGAGRNWLEARTPAFIDSAQGPVALLSYNCVGPESSWATPTQSGCAFVRVATADGSPIAPSALLVTPDPVSLTQMQAEIAAARTQAKFVIVSLHKGLVHTPATLAPYERPISHAAIDAGADIVAGHHAHIVQGIERYRGKPIFHGLGNGCVVTQALSPRQTQGSEAARQAREEWSRKRRSLFGFEPDPAYELAPFHPEAINAMIGRVEIQDGSLRVGFVPIHVEAPGRPTIATGDAVRRVMTYVEKATIAAGLPPITTTFDGACAWIN